MVQATVGASRPLDPAAMAAARERHARLTKPAGSLGALEELSVRLAGLAGCCPPPVPGRAAVAVFAGDHGVHAQGVTPWPQEVTGQMVGNFLAGGAVVNAFAVAAAFAPEATGAMIAGHRSAEPGARIGLARLGLDPLIDLGLRLGEGTGALLALPVVTGAVRVLHEVATFDSAGVSEK